MKSILSWLLHHANRFSKDKEFYALKSKIINKWGTFVYYDVQFIQGKKCHTCGGAGVYVGYSYQGEQFVDYCNRCYNGWYKRPTWNILQVFHFGNYAFHIPWHRVYDKPDFARNIIEGYIEHESSKYGKFALNVLYLIFDFKGFWIRWSKSAGKGYRLSWWLPRNYVYNIAHFIRHGIHAYPFRKWFWQRKRKSKPQLVCYDYGDQLPF